MTPYQLRDPVDLFQDSSWSEHNMAPEQLYGVIYEDRRPRHSCTEQGTFTVVQHGKSRCTMDHFSLSYPETGGIIPVNGRISV